MKEPRWLTRDMVVAMQVDLIREHGGSAGIRDATLLESAIARPRQRWSYDEKVDLAELAAAYGFGLARNHPFLDGNKRVALMSMYTFLLINGFDLTGSEPEAVDVMTGVASGSVREERLGRWIRQHLTRYRE